MQMISKAITFATDKHSEQFDKIGEPYIFHPIRVMLDCNAPVEKLVAILHDTVEDTDATLDDIRSLFDGGNETMADTVVDAVDAITKRKGEEYETYLERVKSNPVALTVKLADIRDNMSPIRQFRLPIDKQNKLKAKYMKAISILS